MDNIHENHTNIEAMTPIKKELRELREYVKTLEAKCKAYEEDRYALLESNWDLVKEKTDYEFLLEEKENRIINLETTIKVLKGE